MLTHVRCPVCWLRGYLTYMTYDHWVAETYANERIIVGGITITADTCDICDHRLILTISVIHHRATNCVQRPSISCWFKTRDAIIPDEMHDIRDVIFQDDSMHGHYIDSLIHGVWIQGCAGPDATQVIEMLNSLFLH